MLRQRIYEYLTKEAYFQENQECACSFYKFKYAILFALARAAAIVSQLRIWQASKWSMLNVFQLFTAFDFSENLFLPCGSFMQTCMACAKIDGDSKNKV